MRGILTSQACCCRIRGLDWRSGRRKLDDGDGRRTYDAFEAHVNADHLPHAVIIDCSASADVAAHYPRWLAAGIHVVTPNKKANSGPLALYAQLHDARREGGAHYLYEATVGAGLPIMQTLRDLRDTGDEIRRIDGIFSGTLAYLFNVCGRQRAVLGGRARRQGQRLHRSPTRATTSPAPTCARKLMILARELGMKLELSRRGASRASCRRR